MELDTWLKEELGKRFIRLSMLPTAAPVFFFKKKDRSWWLVTDYRGLNVPTIKNWYPLPLISHLIGQLLGTTCFTKFDVHNGYNNIWIKEGNEWKGAFICNRELFELVVLYFGLLNSLATLQSYMNNIFEDPILKGWVLIYMDDIMVFAKTMDDLNRWTKAVLRIMEGQELHLKPEKYQFQKQWIEFLGSVISKDGLDTETGKVKVTIE